MKNYGGIKMDYILRMYNLIKEFKKFFVVKNLNMNIK